jgi:hypothetical protein
MYGTSRIYVLWVHKSNWFYVYPGLQIPNWLESYTIRTGTTLHSANLSRQDDEVAIFGPLWEIICDRK